MKRVSDFVLAILMVLLFLLPLLFLTLAVGLTSRGPILHWSDRVGRNNKSFKMPKFRSMYIGTPMVATHLLVNPAACLTPIGSFLRRSSLDELPQLWNIIKGEMSFVGPRPALFNQYDLIEMRTRNGVHALLPGLTGWAQINGRDELPIVQKVALDIEYLNRKSCWFDFKIIILTAWKVIKRDNVTH
jgi:O-antigen biosynthesis protein WbqP